MPQQTGYRNHLLNAMSAADRAAVATHLVPQDFPNRRILETPNQAIRHVYFVERGFASVVAEGKKNSQVEVGLIGREGMSGLAVIMRDDRSPNSTYIQLEGAGLVLPAGKLRELMGASPTLTGLLLNFAHIFMMQIAQTAFANGRAGLEQRLARWLLMGHDRINGDRLPLTHEFLSVMLGVRRAGVTLALQGIEKRGLVKRTRGQIAVVDRAGLEALAGDSYGVPETMYRRLIG
jgi:CRP-like cAMP-binding protein